MKAIRAIELVVLTIMVSLPMQLSAEGYTEKDLFRAAKRNQAQKIGLIISSGVPVDVSDSRGRTPLFVAAKKNRADAVRELLSHGADPLHDTGKGTPKSVAKGQSGSLIRAHLDEMAELNDPNRRAFNALRSGRFERFFEGDTAKLFCALVKFKSGKYSPMELEAYFGRLLVGEEYGDSLVQVLFFEYERTWKGGKTTNEGRWVFGYPRKASGSYSGYIRHPGQFHEVAQLHYKPGDFVIKMMDKRLREYPFCELPAQLFQSDHIYYRKGL